MHPGYEDLERSLTRTQHDTAVPIIPGILSRIMLLLLSCAPHLIWTGSKIAHDLFWPFYLGFERVLTLLGSRYERVDAFGPEVSMRSARFSAIVLHPVSNAYYKAHPVTRAIGVSQTQLANMNFHEILDLEM